MEDGSDEEGGGREVEVDVEGAGADEEDEEQSISPLFAFPLANLDNVEAGKLKTGTGGRKRISTSGASDSGWSSAYA